jgi:hypothetical protein
VTYDDLQVRIGKRVKVRPPRRLWEKLGLHPLTGKLVRVYTRKKVATRCVIDFGKKGTHEVRGAEVLS